MILVGAGPGDPGLMTLRGVKFLRRADLVVYDYLANEEFLQFLSPHAVALYVGKKGGSHLLEQGEINSLLVKEAAKGKWVVRLKGGDPFVFGRGGEEVEVLAKAGIPFEIVPGVTSAIAVPAYSGIPVTHRDFTPTVAFVTGHEREDTAPMTPDWNSLAKLGTVVFLMGIRNLRSIQKNMIAAGRDPETPIAVVEWGTLPRQRVVVGTLRTIVYFVEKAKIQPPAVIILGEVVGLRERLRWFEKKPLFGKRVVVTRSREQASALSRRLQEEGAEVIEIPTIEIRPPTNWKRLDQAIRSLSKYDGILFTSVNGVASFFDRLWKLGRDVRDLKGLFVITIGPATAEEIKRRGVRVDLMAKEYRAEGLIRIMANKKVKGRRILIPRAREGREILIEGLKKLGAKVDLIQAYRSVIPPKGRTQLKELLEENKIDLLTFASSSTVENFIKMAGAGRNPLIARIIRKIPIASIGPITSDTARKHHLRVVVQPRKYTIPAFVEAIISYFQAGGD